MWRRAWRAGLALVSLVGGVASCGSGESAGGGPGGSWFDTYVQRICAKQAVCCQAAGVQNEVSSCRKLYGYFAGDDAEQGHYDGALGEECLAALDSWSCDEPEPEVCNRVITGNAPAGGACSSNLSCAAPEGGYAICLYDSNGPACVQYVPAVVGEPCTPSGSDASVRTQCDAEHGFFCDANEVCQKLPVAGEACTYQCAYGLVCGDADTCVDPVATGGVCASNTDCAATDYCTEGLVCAPTKAWGEACVGFYECDGVCDSDTGKCAPSSYVCSS